MQASPTILIVEDSLSIRETLKAILLDAGYRVHTAENGLAGFEAARSCSPDLILSDLEMPEANGFQLLSRIREDAELAMTPFIMITAITDRTSTRRAMELGADDYLTKPFTPEEVLSTVKSRLAKQQSWREATHALQHATNQRIMGILPHELRTPLNGIIGFAELMSMMAGKGLTPAQTKEFSEIILRSGKTLLSHTTRLLTLMEYQHAEHQNPADASSSLCPMWVEQELQSQLAEQLPTSTVNAEASIESADLHCREDLFRAMLRELVSNAIKFAAPGSTIRIHGQKTADRRYQLDIENPGRAFPSERLQQIGAFVQFDRGTHEQQGLGIGLAIIGHACRMSQSRLNVFNLPEGSVRFRLSIPLRPHQA